MVYFMDINSHRQNKFLYSFSFLASLETKPKHIESKSHFILFIEYLGKIRFELLKFGSHLRYY